MCSSQTPEGIKKLFLWTLSGNLNVRKNAFAKSLRIT
jgi:hypothetical protein